MSVATIEAAVKADYKKIAADVVVVGGAMTAVLVVLIAVAPAVHIPAAAVAVAASLTAVITGIVNQARRISAAKAAAKAK